VHASPEASVDDRGLADGSLCAGAHKGPPVRLFFALWPDEGVRARLTHWSRELHAVCGGRATREENLHLTLAFLGGVEEPRVAEVERAAREVAQRVATLILDRPGYWKHNRIAWAGASVVPLELESILIENADGPGPYGAKGAGEGGILAIAAAIGSAINEAAGVTIRDLPLTLERVWHAIREKAPENTLSVKVESSP